MRITRKLALAGAIAFALAGPLFAQGAAAPEVTRATLDNGLRVVIVRDTLAPVVTTEVNYLVGSNEAPAGFPGTAHAMEHMMFRGGPGLSKDQLAAIAANMGGAFDADTTEGVTQYYFVTPAQDLDVALHVESLRMRGVDVSQVEWNKERGAIEQEVSRDLSSPSFKFYTQLRAQMFAGTPYAHTPLGTRESFDKTSAAMLKQFHDTWYAPNNAVLVIAGDVDPAATLAKVKADFGAIPQRSLPARPAFDFQPVQAKTIALPTDSPYGTVAIAYRGPGLRDQDYAAALVLSQVMGSQRAALAGMGYDGTALFGGFAAQPLPRASVNYAIGVFPRGANPQPILKKMQSILADAAAKGVDPGLVEAAKRKAIAALEFRKNSIDGLANAWSDALTMQGLDSPEAMKQAIAAVTPAQVDALARRIFDPAHAITAVLTPQSSGQPGSGKGFGGAESFAASPDKPVQLPDWAAQAFAKLDMPKSSLDPVAYTLSNGMKLIVQPESVSDTVVVLGRVQTNADLQTPAMQEGVADVLGGMFPFGTKDLDRLKFQQALDAIAASESAGTSFSLAVPAEHFAQGLKLLADNELHPALPEQAFMIVQHQLAGYFAGLLQSPDFLDAQALESALLPSGDPQLRHPTPRSMAGLDYHDVRSYYASVFRPDMTTMVIVGKIDPAQAKAAVEQAFGGWQAQGAKPDIYYPAVPLNHAGQVHTPDSSASQDSVQLAQMIDVNRDDPTRFALTLGNEVLGGGFYASWLYRDLRDKSGLVYNVSTGFDLDKHRGSYTVSYGADPDKVQAAQAMVLQDLKLIQSAPVSQTDLDRAKGILLRRIPLSESSFDGIAGQLLTYAEDGRPLDEGLIAAKHYLELTAPQVQKAYAEHIRLDGFVTAVKGPAPK